MILEGFLGAGNRNVYQYLEIPLELKIEGNMRKYILFCLMFILSACNTRKIASNTSVEKQTENSVVVADNVINSKTNIKIVEYDTIKTVVKDTIIQPIKRVIYVNQVEENTTNVKAIDSKDVEKVDKMSEEKKVNTSIWGYVICFALGAFVIIVLYVFIKFYFRI